MQTLALHGCLVALENRHYSVRVHVTKVPLMDKQLFWQEIYNILEIPETLNKEKVYK